MDFELVTKATLTESEKEQVEDFTKTSPRRKMKAITCLDPIDQVDDTILTSVDPKSLIKQTEHSLELSPDTEDSEHAYTAAKRLVHDFID